MLLLEFLASRTNSHWWLIVVLGTDDYLVGVVAVVSTVQNLVLVLYLGVVWQLG